jgi:hypothetical protein
VGLIEIVEPNAERRQFQILRHPLKFRFCQWADYALFPVMEYRVARAFHDNALLLSRSYFVAPGSRRVLFRHDEAVVRTHWDLPKRLAIKAMRLDDSQAIG